MVSVGKKAAVVAGIFFLLAMVMLSNFSDRKDFDYLDDKVNSMYTDRLMPSAYLFEINNHLYQKKILLETENNSAASLRSSLAMHNQRIDELINSYENTYLTKEEKVEWKNFLSTLGKYNSVETNELLNQQSSSVSPLLNTSFNNMETHLQRLNEIQAKEGKMLQVQSRKLIGSTRLNAWLEISLLFVAAIALLHISGFTEKYNHLSSSKAILN